MAIALIEPSGCEIWHGGLVKVLFDLFLEPDDARYDERHTYVPIKPKAGYPGLVDKEGNPLKQADYDLWLASLPHIWQLAPFHSHFLRFEPDVSQETVEASINHHIPNFYKAWTEEWDKQPGGMRHGWDVACRTPRPRRYDKEFSLPELGTRPQACLDKLNLIVASDLSIRTKDIGETFPSTDIDIGSAATDRSDEWSAARTSIDLANPANDTGSLDTYEIWMYSNGTGIKVGTFSGSGTSYDDRDYETWGDVASGAKRTLTGCDTDVETGDFVGAYIATGYIDISRHTDAVHLYYRESDTFGSGSQTYTLWSFFGEWAMSLYGTGETGGATTYTKTVSMSTLLKAQDDATVALDAYLKAQDTKTIDIDALLRGTATAGIDLDVLVMALGITKTVALDALIKETGTQTVSLDALVKALGIPKTVALDVILGTGGKVEIDLDALLRATDTTAIDIDALLQSLGLTKTVAIDTLLALVKQTETVDIDALLKAQDTETVSLDAWLKGLALVQSINLDALLQATGQEKSVTIDTLLKTIETETIDLDALIKGLGITETVALDILLHGSGIKTIDLDTLLQGQGTITITLDIILREYPARALRYIVEVHDGSGNLLAILQNAFDIPYTQLLNQPAVLDFSIPASDAKKEYLLWGNEIWLRNYRTGDLVKRFRLGSRKDRR